MERAGEPCRHQTARGTLLSAPNGVPKNTRVWWTRAVDRLYNKIPNYIHMYNRTSATTHGVRWGTSPRERGILSSY